MLLLSLVWALAGVLEGVLYADRPPLPLRIRCWLLCIATLLGLGTTLLLMAAHWQLWLLPAILELYRIINAARFLRQRLPLLRLNSIALRAHLWLSLLQTAAALFVWILLQTLNRSELLAGLAMMQLAGALILLRSSLHTWQHSRPIVTAPVLSDKELPSLSVLVPARNETEALQRCLDQLVANDYPKLEIIVLDDNSTTRRTPEIIRSFAQNGVRFIQGALPDETRWLAKNQAYERLRQEASGEILLFCGVDALFEAHSLRGLVAVMQSKGKDMVSVLPLRAASVHGGVSLIQPMRYYWELCLPRRFFKRPPVLSTCWLIRSALLEHTGGFEAVSRSIAPEAYFARQAVVTDAYSFVSSDTDLGVSSSKPVSEQYATSIRMRYPQLHRRIELVALTSLAELILLVGPLVGIFFAALLYHSMAYTAIWTVCTGCLLVTYYLAAVSTKLTSGWLAWALMPVAFLCDIVVQHMSLFKYEFSNVEWKGRNVVQPVMQTIPRSPQIAGD